MEDKIKKIFDLLKNESDEKKINILLECASKIGTEEWKKAVCDLIKRMDRLNKS
ncbi:MAG: hypothetical protein J0H55_16320 [Chitinophagaceae bacterium]|nr:hypothetical protein [Chitinophagaceae bacterium]